MQCLIVADDVTGACDAAGPFAARGYLTQAVLAPGGGLPDVEVLAISTDTRDAPELLAPALAGAARALNATRPGVLFKKIDSTLRGNAPAEIAATLDAFGLGAALVTPAFPAMRRVVAGGWLSISGERDFPPIDLRAHFRCPHAPTGALATALHASRGAVTADASTDADLDALVAAGMACDEPILWAGSSGLAAALARTLPVRQTVAAPVLSTKSILFCAGSDHAATLAQQPVLLESREAVLLDALTCDSAAPATALAQNRHVILRLPRGRVAESRVAELLSRCCPLLAALLLTGGDTASLVYRALGMTGLRLYGEIAPGIPYGAIDGGVFVDVPVVTKSGGFGGPSAFIEVADFFRCPKT